MPDYVPSPRQWVRDQVELYERSGGKEGTTLRDAGLPVIIVTFAVAACPPYAEYQAKTTRQIPVFVAEPKRGAWSDVKR